MVHEAVVFFVNVVHDGIFPKAGKGEDFFLVNFRDSSITLSVLDEVHQKLQVDWDLKCGEEVAKYLLNTLGASGNSYAFLLRLEETQAAATARRPTMKYLVNVEFESLDNVSMKGTTGVFAIFREDTEPGPVNRTEITLLQKTNEYAAYRVSWPPSDHHGIIRGYKVHIPSRKRDHLSS
ncbi:unnamed protein product [Heligmosomoides polygyrus]|uniref:MHD domain-containing protein n=1 Tax=Heligmosomoides polygyrus TaxID=6339 RepID=A0A3P8FEM2_HELPZ|nr:unnamed protein product [Heligmosomoides polygyrus]